MQDPIFDFPKPLEDERGLVFGDRPEAVTTARPSRWGTFRRGNGRVHDNRLQITLKTDKCPSPKFTALLLVPQSHGVQPREFHGVFVHLIGNVLQAVRMLFLGLGRRWVGVVDGVGFCVQKVGRPEQSLYASERCRIRKERGPHPWDCILL